MKNRKNFVFLSNTGPDAIKNHKATKPLGRHQHAMVFRWRANDGPLFVDFDPHSPHQLKHVRDGPL